MANRIEILVEVDPYGRGAASIKKIQADVHGLERSSQRAGVVGRDALGGIASGLGLPTAIGGVTAALTGGIVVLGRQSVIAANEGQNATRILRAEAKEAGLAFDSADVSARKFAETLALDATQGQRTYGELLRLAKAAGELSNVTRHVRGFEDLAAAYGLTAAEVTNLTHQLLSGQDEALNRLGIADPSNLYKKYAAQVGKTVAELGEEERVRARLLAVTEKGERFAGAAEQRLTSEAGQWATLQANISNATRSLGEYLNKYTLIGDLPLILQNPFSLGEALDRRAAATKEAQERRALAEAEARANLYFQEQAITGRRAQLAKDPSLKFQSFDLFTASQRLTPEQEEGIRKQAREAGEVARKEIVKLGIGAAEIAAETARAQTLQLLPDDPDRAAKAEAAAQAARARVRAEYGQRALEKSQSEEEAAARGLRLSGLSKAAEDAKNTFIAQYEKLFKDKRVDVITADFAERQYNEIKGILTPEEREKIAAGLTETFRRFQSEALGYLKGVRKEAEGLFDTLAERYTGDEANPFVKILLEADHAARSLEERFNVLGETVVKELQAVEAAYTRQKLLGAQLDADLTASSLRRQAAKLYEQRPGQLSGAEERQLDIIERRIKVATALPELEAKARALLTGKVGPDGGLGVNKEAVQGETFRQLVRLLEGLPQRGELGRQSRGKVNEELVSLFESLSPELQASIAQGRTPGRETFAAAYTDRAEEQRRQVRDSIERGRLYQEQVTAAEEDVRRIREAEQKGLDTSAGDKRLLARTGELPDEALSPELRRARFDSLTREAERTAAQQAKATEAIDKSRESTDKLTTALDKMAAELSRPENRRLLIEVLDKSRAAVREDLYGDLAPVPVNPNSR